MAGGTRQKGKVYKMSNLHWFIIIALVIVAFAYWNNQRSEGQLKALQENGFVISDNLKGTPNLVISRSQKEIAVPRPDGYLRFPFSRVSTFEVISSSAPEHDYNHRLSLTVQGESGPVNVGFADENSAEKARQRLQQILTE